MFNKTKNNSVIRKEYKYQRGEVNIGITIRTDVKSELRDCIEILNTAIADMKEDLAKLK
jgi:hypothetical protein